MSQNISQDINLTAPAKINLFLHVLDKRHDGYHILQSLTAFADFGDKITISPADEFKFSFDSTSENFPIDENNLIICAANLLAEAIGQELNCHIHLSKHIPIGAGLGGGSSDAAATVRGLLDFWGVEIDVGRLNEILLKLGADVPACYHGKACYFEGVGEIITPVKSRPALPAILIYPNTHCSTKEVFAKYGRDYSEEAGLPLGFEHKDELIEFLLAQQNDLTQPAIQNIGEIQTILDRLDEQPECVLSRMSGSGSACFGVFGTQEQTHEATKAIREDNPDWWVQMVTLR